MKTRSRGVIPVGDLVAARRAYGRWLAIVAGAVPAGIVASLVTTRMAEDRLVAWVGELEAVGPGVTLRNALRRALQDPSLEVVYVRAGSGGWVNELGIPAAAPEPAPGRASTPIFVSGKPIAALVHDQALLRSPQRLRAAVEATALAFGNEQLKAELRAQLDEVRASRSRIVEAADRGRRRLERNLHDGAQQRLVGLALMLRLAAHRAEGDQALSDLLGDATGELDGALADLRELSRGLHPAIVADAGLLAALETLAERPGIPVQLFVDLPEHLPEHVAVGAYYVAAEALANANKHSAARRVTVRATVENDALHLTVADDGSGGAAVRTGSGLEGLADRVSALTGHLVIDSRVGRGTWVSVAIPLCSPRAPARSARSMASLRWVGWESWEVPPEAYDQLTDEDNLNHVKAVVACAGGVEWITPRERAWLLGYHAAAGTAEWVLEEIATYAGTEPVEETVALPSMTATRRGVLHDAMRMCASDGELTSDEVDRLAEGSDAMGIPRQVFADLLVVVAQESSLRHRRYELVAAPALPGTLSEDLEPDR